jgi:hypothetical protein
MATLTLNQVRTNEPDGTYKVVSTVTNADAIPSEIFALASISGEFSHVCNVGELDIYPTTDTPPTSFFRVNTFEKSFTDVATAVRFAAGLKNRVDLLVNEYTTEAAAFAGSEDTDFPLP